MARDTSQTAELQDLTVTSERRRARRLPDFWYRFARNRAAVAGFLAIVTFTIIAFAAPWIATHDPLSISRDRLVSPNDNHYMGTDDLGRDIFSGVVFGTRIALQVGLSVALIASTIGLIVGAFAGYYGGFVDTLLMRVSELFQVLPSFILALVVITLTGPGVYKLIAVIAILHWPATARIVRVQYHSIKSKEFVEAARALGQSNLKIMFRHIMPNALPPAIVTSSLLIAQAILLAAGLGFFGLGDPTVMDWGVMLRNAQRFLDRAWWLSLFPGVAISITVIAFNLIGDGLNDALNPRSRER